MPKSIKIITVITTIELILVMIGTIGAVLYAFSLFASGENLLAGTVLVIAGIVAYLRILNFLLVCSIEDCAKNTRKTNIRIDAMQEQQKA